MSIELSTIAALRQTENVTVTFDSSMSAATIQALIDAQTRNMNKKTLVFQFGDGTYTLNNVLNFNGFYNGVMYIYGNTTETNATTLHTTQSVFLDFNTNADTTCLNLQNCSCWTDIRNFKIRVPSVSGCSGVKCYGNGGGAYVRYNYIYGTAKNNNYGLYSIYNAVYANYNYVSNMHIGLYANIGTISAVNNSHTGTACNYGLYSIQSGRIGKNGTQPTSSTSADEYIMYGGRIYA